MSDPRDDVIIRQVCETMANVAAEDALAHARRRTAVALLVAEEFAREADAETDLRRQAEAREDGWLDSFSARTKAVEIRLKGIEAALSITPEELYIAVFGEGPEPGYTEMGDELIVARRRCLARVLAEIRRRVASCEIT